MESISPPLGIAAIPAASSSPRPRTFQCPSALWDSLEQAARDQRRPVDHLIRDALTQYLQPSSQRPVVASPPDGSPLPRPRPEPTPPPSRAALTPPAPPTPLRPPLPTMPRAAPPLALPPLPASARAPSTASPTPRPLDPHLTPPRPQPAWPPRMAAQPQPAPSPPAPTSLPRPATSARLTPPPFPLPSVSASRPASAPAARLTVVHEGRRHEVTTSSFVIGRGKQIGLSIRDGNISRRHVAIEQEGGAYYLVDLGSTNRTFVNGEPVTKHLIREGDVVRIAEQELLLTFR